MTEPYFDTERDVPVDVEGRSHQLGLCAMCGAQGPVFEGAIELPDGLGGYRYELGLRCVETGDCRKRRRDPSSQPSPRCSAQGGKTH